MTLPKWLNPKTAKEILWVSFSSTVIIELVTLLVRFGLDVEATRDTATTIGQLTRGVRIHHGYIGVALIVVYLLRRRPKTPLFTWILVLGLALLFSDAIHHFLVLWPLTGDPMFHLVYPMEH